MTPAIGHLPHLYKKVTTYTMNMCERALYEVLLAEKLCVVYFEKKRNPKRHYWNKRTSFRHAIPRPIYILYVTCCTSIVYSLIFSLLFRRPVSVILWFIFLHVFFVNVKQNYFWNIWIRPLKTNKRSWHNNDNRAN